MPFTIALIAEMLVVLAIMLSAAVIVKHPEIVIAIVGAAQ